MHPKDLAAHKSAPKLLAAAPRFKKFVRHALPKPFNRIGRQGSQSTDVLAVSDDHRVLFMWHDGPQRTDRSFYAYLLSVARNGDLYPLFEFHYHPAREFDPALEHDRAALIKVFCKAVGIETMFEDDRQGRLWN